MRVSLPVPPTAGRERVATRRNSARVFFYLIGISSSLLTQGGYLFRIDRKKKLK
jgi:hypothetical protein